MLCESSLLLTRVLGLNFLSLSCSSVFPFLQLRASLFLYLNFYLNLHLHLCSSVERLICLHAESPEFTVEEMVREKLTVLRNAGNDSIALALALARQADKNSHKLSLKGTTVCVGGIRWN